MEIRDQPNQSENVSEDVEILEEEEEENNLENSKVEINNQLVAILDKEMENLEKRNNFLKTSMEELKEEYRKNKSAMIQRKHMKDMYLGLSIKIGGVVMNKKKLNTSLAKKKKKREQYKEAYQEVKEIKEVKSKEDKPISDELRKLWE